MIAALLRMRAVSMPVMNVAPFAEADALSVPPLKLKVEVTLVVEVTDLTGSARIQVEVAVPVNVVRPKVRLPPAAVIVPSLRVATQLFPLVRPTARLPVPPMMSDRESTIRFPEPPSELPLATFPMERLPPKEAVPPLISNVDASATELAERVLPYVAPVSIFKVPPPSKKRPPEVPPLAIATLLPMVAVLPEATSM